MPASTVLEPRPSQGPLSDANRTQTGQYEQTQSTLMIYRNKHLDGVCLPHSGASCVDVTAVAAATAADADAVDC